MPASADDVETGLHDGSLPAESETAIIRDLHGRPVPVIGSIGSIGSGSGSGSLPLDGSLPVTVGPEPKPEPLSSPRHIGVLRHAERLDDLEPAVADEHVGEKFAWPDRGARPYDTPISNFDKPWAAAALLKEFGFTRVVSSPFRRCLQTAAVAAAELGIETVDVHKGIGEAMAKVKRSGWPDEPGGHELTYLTDPEMDETLAAAAQTVDGGSAVRLGEVSGETPTFGQDDVKRMRYVRPLASLRSLSLLGFKNLMAWRRGARQGCTVAGGG